MKFYPGLGGFSTLVQIAKERLVHKESESIFWNYCYVVRSLSSSNKCEYKLSVTTFTDVQFHDLLEISRVA